MNSTEVVDNQNIPDSTNMTVEILPDSLNKYDVTFKLIVIGDAAVGKSSLTSRAIKNVFNTDYTATVGFEFMNKNVKVNDTTCKLQIWDTCGQEVYRSLIVNFYRNSALAIIVYAIDDRDSFTNLNLWIKELKKHANPDVKVFVIANKADLEENRKVSTEEGKQFVEDNNLHLFLETSAKTGFNSQKIFVEASKLLYLDFVKYKDTGRFRSISTNSISSYGSSYSRNSIMIRFENDKKERERISSKYNKNFVKSGNPSEQIKSDKPVKKSCC